jgi:hypothetical protein
MGDRGDDEPVWAPTHGSPQRHSRVVVGQASGAAYSMDYKDFVPPKPIVLSAYTLV